MRKLLFGLIGAAFYACGCQTASRNLRPVSIQFFDQGAKTRTEVVEEFGQPTEVVQGEAGSLLVYERFFAASPGMGYAPAEDSYLRTLSVLVDPEGHVVDHHYHQSEIPTHYVGGSASIGRRIDSQTLEAIKPNVTSLKQVKRLLGAPSQETLTLTGLVVYTWIYSQADFVAGPTATKVLQVYVDDSGVVVAAKTLNYK